ncbi:hypothetical protein [Paraburkholderia sp. MM6662-R1]|uniref:hypothetical protein n=1 Tax=Paraburkholderia sp. MM6662-R1 TaxID=2991066 RepID=UPI003D25BC0A
MIDSDFDDPLMAWNDCYETKPKKRILKRAAKIEIKRAWANWNGDKTATGAELKFYSWLWRHRPYFLTYRKNCDRWQDVKIWIIQYEDECAARRGSLRWEKHGAGMKGKSTFSQADAARIRDLLRQVRTAATDEQKKFRDRLRIDVGFYISDFTKSNVGFTAEDFDGLVERGTIKIV